MKQYRTREGDITAVDTKTEIKTLGSESTPGPLVVPLGMKFITKIRVAVIQNMAAATSYGALLRLEGAGLQNGPESFAIGAGGNNVATGGNAVATVRELAVNLPVVETNEIMIYGEMVGTDVGALGVVVGLEFSDAAGEGAGEHKTLTVEGDIATVDTRTILNTQGSVTSPSLLVPAGYTKIDKIFVAGASEALADGKATLFLRLGGNAVKGGEQVLPISAIGRIAVQSGSDSAPQVCPVITLENLEIEVTPSDTISITSEMAGDDVGTSRVVATLVFAK